MKEGEDDTPPPPHPYPVFLWGFLWVFTGQLGVVLFVCWGEVFFKDHAEFPSILFPSSSTRKYSSVSSCFVNFQYFLRKHSINFYHTFHGMPTIRKVLKTGMLFKARGEEGIPSSRLSCTWEIQDQMKKYILNFKNACVLVSPSIQQLDQNVITTSN